MQNKIRVFALTAVLGASVSLLAGGFALEVANPANNPEAQARKAVMVVRGYVCSQPEKTAISATAEGLVNGQRKTVALALTALAAQSTYAITRQWPPVGRWVITVTASNPKFGWKPGAIVKTEGDTVDFADVKRFNRPPTDADVMAALGTTAVASR